MSQSKKSSQVASMIDRLKKSDEPVPFSDLCAKVDAKYPQDVNAAMIALEHVGLVKRTEGAPIAYAWVGDRPAKRTRAAKAA